MNSLGERVRKLRNQKDMELKKLAAQAKISIGFLADIESGRSNPSIKTLKKLADALGTSPDYLLSGKNGNFTPWYDRDKPPTDIELDEFIEKTPNLRLYGELLDEQGRKDVRMGLRIIFEHNKIEREEKAKKRPKKK